ncbi:MAG: EamA family transporter [Oscillospiraceae bacterium]|nr:EamA family transporter [Oscillospiraceae bacterium]
MWFIYTIVTIILWGGTDLFYKLGSRREDNYSHLKITIFVGMVMGIHAIVVLLATGTEFQPLNIIRYLPVSLLYILSMIIGYVGLRYIELSIASPVGNSSGAIAFILCFIFLKAQMTVVQIAAVAVVSVGIYLLALLNQPTDNTKTEKDKRYRTGAMAIIFPVLYCIIDGVGTFSDALILDRVMDETQALISYELTFLAVGILSFIYLRVIKQQQILLFEQKPRLVAAVLETAGQVFYVRAMATNAILAAPLIACYSIASILLSRIFLKEKLSITQYVIVAAVVIAIGILGFE